MLTLQNQRPCLNPITVVIMQIDAVPAIPVLIYFFLTVTAAEDFARRENATLAKDDEYAAHVVAFTKDAQEFLSENL